MSDSFSGDATTPHVNNQSLVNAVKQKFHKGNKHTKLLNRRTDVRRPPNRWILFRTTVVNPALDIGKEKRGDVPTTAYDLELRQLLHLKMVGLRHALDELLTSKNIALPREKLDKNRQNELSPLVSAIWKAMSQAEKGPWDRAAMQINEWHKATYPDFDYTGKGKAKDGKGVQQASSKRSRSTLSGKATLVGLKSTSVAARKTYAKPGRVRATRVAPAYLAFMTVPATTTSAPASPSSLGYPSSSTITLSPSAGSTASYLTPNLSPCGSSRTSPSSDAPYTPVSDGNGTVNANRPPWFGSDAVKVQDTSLKRELSTLIQVEVGSGSPVEPFVPDVRGERAVISGIQTNPASTQLAEPFASKCMFPSFTQSAGPVDTQFTSSASTSFAESTYYPFNASAACSSTATPSALDMAASTNVHDGYPLNVETAVPSETGYPASTQPVFFSGMAASSSATTWYPNAPATNVVAYPIPPQTAYPTFAQDAYHNGQVAYSDLAQTVYPGLADPAVYKSSVGPAAHAGLDWAPESPTTVALPVVQGGADGLADGNTSSSVAFADAPVALSTSSFLQQPGADTMDSSCSAGFTGFGNGLAGTGIGSGMSFVGSYLGNDGQTENDVMDFFNWLEFFDGVDGSSSGNGF
ncbi:hypothetical protein FISHEDRAFT_68916 [Fistulina hepatica ATCC 64428]|uniref:HMG box domain-containing protein n=1 Tax=Fistulina hepatica ATCC 64428 TaxID=1128425 RepID=A0A0D7AQ47_9AGAR|nr:hypothetical protein FISHEDRAFT_68916 [Fistulina hepatica ATCC 64428]